MPFTFSLGQASFKDCHFGTSINGFKQDGGWLLVAL